VLRAGYCKSLHYSIIERILLRILKASHEYQSLQISFTLTAPYGWLSSWFKVVLNTFGCIVWQYLRPLSLGLNRDNMSVETVLINIKVQHYPRGQEWSKAQSKHRVKWGRGWGMGVSVFGRVGHKHIHTHIHALFLYNTQSQKMTTSLIFSALWCLLVKQSSWC